VSPGPVPLFAIDALDRALRPALPPGWLALVEGDAGGANRLLAKQAAHAAAASVPVYYYTTDELAGEVARSFDEFGWESSGIQVVELGHEYYADLLQRDLAVARARARGLTLAEAQLGHGERALPAVRTSLANRLLSEIAPLEGPFRVVLDSYDLLLEELEAAHATRLARQIRHQALTSGGSAVLALDPEATDPRTLAQLELLSDLILETDLEEQGRDFSLRIVVRKVRNHPERSQILRGSIGEKGIEALAP
jgi:KaiC/GvpD/RAD55 family RecA-like ATPase